MGLPEFPKRFLASGRVGFYLRVLQEGKVGAGDVIDRITIGEGGLTVRELNHLRFFDPGNLERAREILRALAPRWRSVFEDGVPRRLPGGDPQPRGGCGSGAAPAGLPPCMAYLKTYQKTRDLVHRSGQVAMPEEMKTILRRFVMQQLGREKP